MRKIIIKSENPTEKVTTLNTKTLSLLKRNILPDDVLYDLVENSNRMEAEVKIDQIVNKRITKRYPNLSKVAPLVFERYVELLKSHVQEKVESCLMPRF